MRPRPPALFSEAPSRIAAPRSIARATSAQASLRTRSASRRDSSPSSALRKGAEQHVGDDEAEHMVAEEFEPLIAAGAIARPGQRGDMRQRLLEQRGILEVVADALLEARRRLAPAAPASRSGVAGAAAVLPSAWRELSDGGAGDVAARLALSACGSSHDREQPAPAHRPRPAPELPGALTFADREEDDLRRGRRCSRTARSRPGSSTRLSVELSRLSPIMK